MVSRRTYDALLGRPGGLLPRSRGRSGRRCGARLIGDPARPRRGGGGAPDPLQPGAARGLAGHLRPHVRDHLGAAAARDPDRVHRRPERAVGPGARAVAGARRAAGPGGHAARGVEAGAGGDRAPGAIAGLAVPVGVGIALVLIRVSTGARSAGRSRPSSPWMFCCVVVLAARPGCPGGRAAWRMSRSRPRPRSGASDVGPHPGVGLLWRGRSCARRRAGAVRLDGGRLPLPRRHDAPVEALGATGPGFARAVVPREFVSPGPRSASAFQTEWWYWTGNLRASTRGARRFGFQLTFFRSALAPTPAARVGLGQPARGSAHFALTDVEAGGSTPGTAWRAGAGLAGAAADSAGVWLGLAPTRPAAERSRFAARQAASPLALASRGASRRCCRATAASHGRTRAEGNASYYYSLTRLPGAAGSSGGARSRSRARVDGPRVVERLARARPDWLGLVRAAAR